ncbi:hypothetical protein [Deinococcus multiflagellatus]|uniref:Uncharacterized protein n=1 Tax=Deinococcus multiflagellatus TaxID=1656887 RepID=A0ABW1ZI78_9DEIO|nr:hypothetical protein [Deinococcus multiflagellatus]MBZ9713726.1 hypothetical protein [Deinococcus multiflagellatus]
MTLLVQFWELRRLPGDTWEVLGVTYEPRQGTRTFRALIAEIHVGDSSITATDGERYPLARCSDGTQALAIVAAELEAREAV